jgi:hypothetical protein
MGQQRNDDYTWEERQYKEFGPYNALVDREGRVRAGVMPTSYLRPTPRDLAAVVLYDKQGNELDSRVHMQQDEARFIAEYFVTRQDTSPAPWRFIARPSPDDVKKRHAKHKTREDKTRGDEGMER